MLNIKTTDNIQEGGDSLGGFKVWESDAYEALVKVVYLGTAKSGAQFAGIHLTIDGKEYREQVYFTNKAGENYYTKDGKAYELPGFQTVNELCLMTTGVGLMDGQNVEEKIVKLYDPEAKAETNQSVPVLVDLLNKPVVVGIIKEIVNKQKKNDSTGNYEDIAEKREQNQISKFFHHETKGTATEYKKDLKLGTFFEEWVSQNKGNTRDRYKEPSANGGAPGRPGQAGGQQQATKSLFNRS